MLGVRLPENLERHLNDMSKKTGYSKSAFAIEALEEYLEEEYLYHQAVSAYEDYLRSGKKSIPWEDVQKELGLLDEK